MVGVENHSGPQDMLACLESLKGVTRGTHGTEPEDIGYHALNS